MRILKPTHRIVFGGLALALLLTGSRSVTEETVLDKLKDAVEREDFRTIKKLVEVVPSEVIGAFFSAAEAHLESLRTGESERAQLYAEVMVKIGNAYYVSKNDSDLERYAQFIKSLRLVKGQTWLEGWSAYRKYREASIAAWETPDLALFSKAIELGEKVGPYFERINDYYLLGWIYQDLGRFYSQKSSEDEAREQYEQAKQFFDAFGAKGKVQETQSFLDQLAQGRLKTALEEKQAVADAEAQKAKEEAEKPLWQSISLTYRPSERMDFDTPNPLSTNKHVLWSGNRIEEGKFGPFYDNSVFEAAAFMSYYANDTVGIRPRTYSPVARYQFMHENKRMYLDYNDDGFAQKNERVNLGGRPGFVEFALETEDGESFRYAVNMCELKEEQFFAFKTRYGPGNVRWQRACYMQGELPDGKRIILIDDNNNGTYSDWGSDSIVIGSGKKGIFLSDMIDVDGSLFRVKMESPLGNDLQIMPVSDATLGSVEVKFKGKVTPQSLYIVGAGKTGKTTIFPLDLKKPVQVPIGRYSFYFGMIKDGRGKSVEIRQGQSEPFDVNEGETTLLEMGAPFTFDYRVRLNGDNAEIRGSDLVVLGASKESYTRFYPEIPRGEIRVKGSKVGIVAKEKLKPIDQAIFNQGTHLAWFPRNVSWPRVKDVEYSARIRAKHSLLGSISADFK